MNSKEGGPKKQVRRVPWWATIIMAIVTYCGLKYLLPELTPSNQTLQELFALGPVVAPVLTIPFLLLAAKQLYDVELPKRDNEDEDSS